MWLASFFPNPWLQDIVALFLTFAVALAWLRFADLLAHLRLVSRPLSRKLIHIGIGPLFVLCWLLYSDSPQSRWLAALVPALITLQFALIGLGIVKDESAVQAMSRSGQARELLRGPVQYGVIFVLVTVVFWLHSPVGIVVLMLLCGGDGLADVVGRRWGRAPLSFNPRKTWAGSMAMLIAGFALSLAYLALFNWWGAFDVGIRGSLLPLLLIALAATLIEAVSGTDMDNITVPITALGAAWLLSEVTGLWQAPFLG